MSKLGSKIEIGKIQEVLGGFVVVAVVWRGFKKKKQTERHLEAFLQALPRYFQVLTQNFGIPDKLPRRITDLEYINLP